MHEIFIYGEIVPFKYWGGDSEFDLNDLNKALQALDVKEGETVTVNLNTPGGCTVTGFAMYNKLRRFKNEKKINLRTRVDGYCASIGVVILLAGDIRIGNAYAEPFVHNAFMYLMGVDKNDAQKVYEDLVKTDNQIANCYAERTNIAVEKALELMNAETWITPEDCVVFGFYTELENVMVADREIFNSLRSLRNEQVNKNNINTDMSNKNKNAKSLLNQIKDFLSTAKNKIVFTADSSELDFFELEDGDTPKVGDKANFDGKPAGESNDGTYLLASGETYKFEGDELTEIVAKVEETVEDEVETVENLKEQITELENKLSIANSAKKDLKAKLGAANLRVTEAEKIIKNISNLDLEDDDEDEEEPTQRTPRKTTNTVSTRNIIASLDN